MRGCKGWAQLEAAGAAGDAVSNTHACCKPPHPPTFCSSQLRSRERGRPLMSVSNASARAEATTTAE